MKNKTSVGIIGIFVIIVVFLAGSHILYRPQYYSQKYVELTDSWSVRGVVEEDNVNLRNFALPQMCQGDQVIFTTVLPEISNLSPVYDNCIIKGDLRSPSSAFYKKVKIWLFFTKKNACIFCNEEAILCFS